MMATTTLRGTPFDMRKTAGGTVVVFDQGRERSDAEADPEKTEKYRPRVGR